MSVVNKKKTAKNKKQKNQQQLEVDSGGKGFHWFVFFLSFFLLISNNVFEYF